MCFTLCRQIFVVLFSMDFHVLLSEKTHIKNASKKKVYGKWKIMHGDQHALCVLSEWEFLSLNNDFIHYASVFSFSTALFVEVPISLSLMFGTLSIFARYK